MTAKLVTPSRVGLVFALFALGACGTTTTGGGGDTLDVPVGTKPYRPYMVGVPYTINGREYTPKEDLNYDRTGIASWYGTDFHGRRTANGETYDISRRTAAHPTLPLPTIARVTNLENNRSILVRINDRGPFANDRIIDLSRQAATDLGFLKAGTARVRVTVLRARTEALKRQGGFTTVASVSSPMKGPDPMDPTHRDRVGKTTPEDKPATTVTVAEKSPSEDRPAPVARRDTTGDDRSGNDRTGGDAVSRDDRPRSVGPVDLRPRDMRADDRITAPKVVASPTSPATVRHIFVQAGAYTERDRALRIGRKLQPLGKTSVSTILVRETRFYRVRVGPVRTADEGDRVLARMVSMGYTGARIVVD